MALKGFLTQTSFSPEWQEKNQKHAGTAGATKQSQQSKEKRDSPCTPTHCK
jgi:hypothetical protein